MLNFFTNPIHGAILRVLRRFLYFLTWFHLGFYKVLKTFLRGF